MDENSSVGSSRFPKHRDQSPYFKAPPLLWAGLAGGLPAGTGTGRFHASATQPGGFVKLASRSSGMVKAHFSSTWERFFCSPKDFLVISPHGDILRKKNEIVFLELVISSGRFFENHFGRNPLVHKEEKFFVDRDIPSNKWISPRDPFLKKWISLRWMVWRQPHKKASQVEKSVWISPVQATSYIHSCETGRSFSSAFNKKWQPKKNQPFHLSFDLTLVLCALAKKPEKFQQQQRVAGRPHFRHLGFPDQSSQPASEEQSLAAGWMGGGEPAVHLPNCRFL